MKTMLKRSVRAVLWSVLFFTFFLNPRGDTLNIRIIWVVEQFDAGREGLKDFRGARESSWSSLEAFFRPNDQGILVKIKIKNEDSSAVFKSTPCVSV